MGGETFQGICKHEFGLTYDHKIDKIFCTQCGFVYKDSVIKCSEAELKAEVERLRARAEKADHDCGGMMYERNEERKRVAVLEKALREISDAAFVHVEAATLQHVQSAVQTFATLGKIYQHAEAALSTNVADQTQRSET